VDVQSFKEETMNSIITQAFMDELSKISGQVVGRVGRVGLRAASKFMEPYQAAAKGIVGAARKVIPPTQDGGQERGRR